MTKESDEAPPQSPLCASSEKLPFDPSLSLLRLNWALIAALAAGLGRRLVRNHGMVKPILLPLTSTASAHA